MRVQWACCESDVLTPRGAPFCSVRRSYGGHHTDGDPRKVLTQRGQHGLCVAVIRANHNLVIQAFAGVAVHRHGEVHICSLFSDFPDPDTNPTVKRHAFLIRRQQGPSSVHVVCTQNNRDPVWVSLFERAMVTMLRFNGILSMRGEPGQRRRSEKFDTVDLCSAALDAQQVVKQRDQIQPLEWRVAQSTVVQVVAIDVDSGFQSL